MVNSPIFELFGQPAPCWENAVSEAYCAGVQTPRPAPSEGLTVTPSGNDTTAVFVCEGARTMEPRSPSLLLVRMYSKPVGEDARGSVRAPTAWGSKGTVSQACRAGAS